MSALARQPVARSEKQRLQRNEQFADIGSVADHGQESSNDEQKARGSANSGDGSRVRADGLNEELAGRWLSWQCKMIADVITGCVCDSDGRFLAMVPEKGEGIQALENAVRNAANLSREFVATEVPFGDSNGRLADIVATPVKTGGRTIAYVALLMTPRPQSRQNVVLQLLQWGGYWLESLSHLSDGVQLEAGSFTQDLFAAVLQHKHSSKSCLEIVNRLAERLDCERVTIGLKKGLVVRTECISYLATFDPRTQLVRKLEAAMEESLDQDRRVVLPPIFDDAGAIDQANRELVNQDSSISVATFPLQGHSENFGAIVFERDARKPFDKDTARWCESVLSAIAPVVELKLIDERPLRAKALDACKETVRQIFGPEQLKLKMAGLAFAAIILFGSVFNGDYKVSAPASIEGSVSQVIAAPVAGFIKTAQARAGDRVAKGQLMATLDDRSLQLELNKWQGEANKIKKAYQEALAKKARTELSILRARSDQIDAELALVEQRIARTELRAPHAGYVTSGDLSQSMGAPVEVGDVLFEVAPLQDYRVIMEIDERDMAGIKKDNTGQVVIKAIPGEPVDIAIDQIVPMAISGDGNTYFRVEGKFDNPGNDLRPGMEGVARIHVGERKLLWIWTHKVVDRIRLWLWARGW
jgi:RND family efflux transporter MFP subunit